MISAVCFCEGSTLSQESLQSSYSAARKPFVVDTAFPQCSNRTHFNTVTRALNPTALYIKIKSALSEEELAKHGCLSVSL